jgi:hypothetical protein
VYSVDLRQIFRKAHAVSLRAYESAREQIQTWVREWREEGEQLILGPGRL